MPSRRLLVDKEREIDTDIIAGKRAKMNQQVLTPTLRAEP